MGQPIILYGSRFNDGNPTATDEAAGFSVLNIKDYRTYTFYKAATAGTKEIKVNCGSAKSADCLGIIGHNLADAGATISVESSPDDAVWTERLAGFTVSTNKAILKTFNFVSAKWWKLKITGATVAPQIAVANIDSRLQFPYPPDRAYVPYSEGIEAEVSRSKQGHPLGATINYHPRSIKPNFSNLSRTFVFDTYLPFWENQGSKLLPFFYAEDLNTFPEHVFYVQMTEGSTFNPPLSISSLVDSLTLDMVGVRE